MNETYNELRFSTPWCYAFKPFISDRRNALYVEAATSAILQPVMDNPLIKKNSRDDMYRRWYNQYIYPFLNDLFEKARRGDHISWFKLSTIAGVYLNFLPCSSAMLAKYFYLMQYKVGVENMYHVRFKK